ncbi:MAG: restriction endonuclease subunit S [Candidatus Uhrbacteria bacterium]|nr:restriction endonuclease subunit S [Candidatus Uhrbacteria bacterium]
MIWPTKKLGEVAKIIMGQSPSSSTYNESGEGLPFYQGKKDYGDINPTVRIWCSVPGKVVEAGDILISVRAPVGALNIASERSCIGRGLSGIRAGKYLDQGFLYHFLRGKEIEIASWGTGSTFASISKKHLENIEIPIPPIAEQRRTVEKIEKQFAKIDEAARLRAESEAATAALLPAALHEVFSSAESKGWKLEELQNISDQITDGTHNAPPYVSSGVPMVDTKNIDDHRNISLEKATKFISTDTDNLLSRRCKPMSGDVLISSRGTIGRIGIVKQGQDFNIMGNIILLRPGKNLISEFLSSFLQYMVADINTVATGTSQKGLYLNKMRKYLVPLPSLAEQKKIVKKLDALSLKVRALRELQLAQSADLKALKQSILHEAFSGNS